MAASKGMKMFLSSSALSLLAVIAMPSASTETETAAVPDMTAARLTATRRPVGQTSETKPAEDIVDLVARAAAMDWGRDPFQPPSQADFPPAPEPEVELESHGSLPSLTGIGESDAKFLAILDEQVLATGAVTTSGFTVVSIDTASVTLLRDGEQHTLTLSEGPK